MKLMVRVAGQWTTGIDDWQNTFMQQMLRRSWERDGCETRFDAKEGL